MLTLKVPQVADLKPRIAVIGVGGAGGNAVNNMIASGITGVEYIVANTDAQALISSSAERRIQLGATLTEGLGAGAKPERGEAAAEEAVDEIRSHLAGTHMVFIAAGMGGGTGTGAAPVIARVARELGLLTVAIVTKPFEFEGMNRMRMAEAGIAALRAHVDTMIVIPNHNLFRLVSQRTSFKEAFRLADDVLISGVSCITELIVKEGLINLDLADVKTVLTDMGTAMMGTGIGQGEQRALAAAEMAVMNPLLDEIDLSTARGLIISIVGGDDLSLHDVDQAANRIRSAVAPDAVIIVGTAINSEMTKGEIRVSIVASGMTAASARRAQAAQPSPIVTEPFQPQREAPSPSSGQPLPQSPAAMTQPPLQQGYDYGQPAGAWRGTQPAQMPSPTSDTGYHQAQQSAHPTGQWAPGQNDYSGQYPVDSSPLFADEQPAAHDPRWQHPAVSEAQRPQPVQHAQQHSAHMPAADYAGATQPQPNQPQRWVTADGVEIEERQPSRHESLSATIAATVNRQAPSHDLGALADQQPFVPQQTASIRALARRPVEVSDFNQHGQNVFNQQQASARDPKSVAPHGDQRSQGAMDGTPVAKPSPAKSHHSDDDTTADGGRGGGILWRFTAGGFRRK